MDFVSLEELMANHASMEMQTPASHISVHVENVALNNPMVISVQPQTIVLQVGVAVLSALEHVRINQNLALTRSNVLGGVRVRVDPRSGRS